MKNIKVPLSVNGLKDLSNKINNLKTELKQSEEKIVEKLANYTKTEIENNLSSTQFKDGNDNVSTFVEKNGNRTKVGMRGSQVLYDEFGTGTEGQKSPHPYKGKYSLSGYNTGKRIRKASATVNEKTGILIGTMYWTYKNKQGETVYTTGIPAGKQVFNAAISLRNKKKQIIKQEVSDVLSKL